MFDIKLYTCTCDNRLVDKTNKLTLIRDFSNCVLKNITSTMDVTLTFHIDNMELLTTANYVYIPSLSNYYFVDDIIFGGANQVTLKCHEDVLMSYKDDILKLNCTIARNTILKNGYLVDPQYKTVAYEEIVTKGFPQEISGFSTILMTVG